MAYEIPGFTFTLVTAADLSALQFYHVKLNASGLAVAVTAVTDIPIGILQNKPESGEEATIMVSGISKINSDAALSINDQIGAAADGQAAAYVAGTDTTKYITGIVLVASAAAAGYATALINCMALNRGA